MDVKILGTGCPKCQKLTQIVTDVAARNGIALRLEKVTNINDIMKYNIMMTPGLVINGQVKSAGKLPNESEILTWLKEA